MVSSILHRANYYLENLTSLERGLERAGFPDYKAAARCLQRLARGAGGQTELFEFLPELLHDLSSAADPNHALIQFERFCGSVADQRALYTHLANNPRAVDILVKLFSSSQFLTEILLRNPEYFGRVVELRRLSQVKSVDQLGKEAVSYIEKYSSLSEQLDALRRFQRWELLRIGICDLMDHFDLPTTTGQLSSLADGLAQVSLALLSRQLNCPSEGFAIIGMGKLGGRELNYSSDIDLLFVSATDEDCYRKLGERFIEALARVTEEGFLYRVDMRLRPWGHVGMLVPSLAGYIKYLKNQARLWEKQAMLKARYVAGDEGLANEFLLRARPLIFNNPPEMVRSEVHAMKQRTEAYLRQKGRGWGEVKLGAGTIRDIEFVIQYLQLIHGGNQPEIRSRNTLRALPRLLEYRLLPLEEYRVLMEGYTFFRTVEHHLQMMDYRQTYTLPNQPDELNSLARRLGFEGKPNGVQAGELFLQRYQRHAAAVRSVYLKYLESVEMKDESFYPSSPAVRRHIGRMDPSYETVFSEMDIQRHTLMADSLDDEHLSRVEVTPLEDETWRVTIVAYDYPGELSLICGLFFVYGCNILDGNVFTYEPEKSDQAGAKKDLRRKIVDVFTVHRDPRQQNGEAWKDYASDLEELLRMTHKGQRQEALVQLAKRAARVVPDQTGSATPLYPIGIVIDNETSEHYTILRIDAMDTIGFLYQLTTALALNQVYIARVEIDSIGERINDVLYVTDAEGRKITSPQKLRELRTATVLIKHFTHLLPHSPDPQSALLHFREFIAQLFRREDWVDELASLERPEVLEALAKVLGVSDFLWQDFLRMQYANLFPVVKDVDALVTAKSRAQLQQELEEALLPVHSGPQPPSEDVAWRVVLNSFKDREMFRIDMRHILGHTQEFWDFAEELTDLAEVVVNAAYHLSGEDLRSVYGTPRLENGEIAEMSVCALGKCGGRELGFASDIELMFIYSGNGLTTGPEIISNSEFFEKVVENFVRSIIAKREGIFEIDLQLRPYGKVGSLAVSLEAFRRYFAPGGAAWAYERQALVKLRPIAGNKEFGRQIAELRDEYVYTGEPFDVTAMRAMRERQIRHLVKGGTFNPKYSPGGLVDVEYLVQGLQINHGREHPEYRLTNTRAALAALARGGVISDEDYQRLRKSYTFLRWLIDSLRVVAGNAKDLVVPPEDSEHFAFLARRLKYGENAALLAEELRRYSSAVQEINRKLLG